MSGNNLSHTEFQESQLNGVLPAQLHALNPFILSFILTGLLAV
jgi:hypothetical protein